MLQYRDGDLLKSDCTVIMHQANCFKTMGAGIAKSICQLYPSANKADKDYPFVRKQRLGKFSHAIVNNITIVNLYGQYFYGVGKQTNYKALENAIDLFLTHAKNDININLSKVGVPYRIGAGLAGGNWDLIKGILDRQSNKHGINIYIYKL